MTETVAPGTTRHLCPLACGWQYDEAPPGPDGCAGIGVDLSAENLHAAVASVVEQAAYRRADAVETVIREHIATHGIHTVGELRAAIAAARPDPGEWTARYMRFHARGQEGFDSLDEAVGFLAWQSEEGKLAGLDVLGPDGAVVLAGDDLDRAVAERLGFA